MPTALTVIDPNRPWIGREYEARRIFVLGESYTGSYEEDLEYDDAYMDALLTGKLHALIAAKPHRRRDLNPDLFIKMAEKLGLTTQAFWHQVAFTNMSIGSIGASNATKVTTSQLNAGRPRLEALLQRLAPEGVLILGVKTGEAASPVCRKLGIEHRTIYHPSGVNNANPRTACTPEMVKSAWLQLCALGPPSNAGSNPKLSHVLKVAEASLTSFRGVPSPVVAPEAPARSDATSESEIVEMVQRLEAHLSSSPLPQVAALYAQYIHLRLRFEHDLRSSSRDIALAKASALMLLQSAEQTANAA